MFISEMKKKKTEININQIEIGLVELVYKDISTKNYENNASFMRFQV